MPVSLQPWFATRGEDNFKFSLFGHFCSQSQLFSSCWLPILLSHFSLLFFVLGRIESTLERVWPQEKTSSFHGVSSQPLLIDSFHFHHTVCVCLKQAFMLSLSPVLYLSFFASAALLIFVLVFFFYVSWQHEKQDQPDRWIDPREWVLTIFPIKWFLRRNV